MLHLSPAHKRRTWSPRLCVVNDLPFPSITVHGSMRPLSALHEPTPRGAGPTGQFGYSRARPAPETHRFDCKPITNLRLAGNLLRTMAQLNNKSTGIMCNPVMDPDWNVDRC